MPNQETKHEVDIAVLKRDVDELNKNVELIMNNHLPHINAKLSKIENKIAYWSGGMAVIVIVAEVIMKFMN